jgi:hypothetical protein
MRIVALALAAGLIGCGTANRAGTAGPAASDHAALLAAREAVWRAYFAGDSALLVALLPERMVGMPQDRAEIIADAQRFRAGGGVLRAITFSDDEIVMRDGIAVTYARYQVQLENAGRRDSMTGFAIELFVKEGGRWTNPSWHLHEGR